MLLPWTATGVRISILASYLFNSMLSLWLLQHHKQKNLETHSLLFFLSEQGNSLIFRRNITPLVLNDNHLETHDLRLIKCYSYYMFRNEGVKVFGKSTKK